MALPLTAPNAASLFLNFQQWATTVKELAQRVQSGDVPSTTVATLLAQIINLNAQAQALAADKTAFSSLIAYAQEVTGNPTADYGADFAASLAAGQALVAALIKDYPVDGQGHVLDRTIDANGNITALIFSAEQLKNTISAIGAWLATMG